MDVNQLLCVIDTKILIVTRNSINLFVFMTTSISFEVSIVKTTIQVFLSLNYKTNMFTTKLFILLSVAVAVTFAVPQMVS